MDENVPVTPDVLGQWNNVISDMEDTASTYRNEGWETLELHPGDVTVYPTESERNGLDILLPGNEFDELNSLIDENDATFDEFMIFRELHDEIIYCLIVAEDESTEVAVLIPIYFLADDASTLGENISSEGRIQLHLHSLSEESGFITFTMEDPKEMFSV